MLGPCRIDAGAAPVSLTSPLVAGCQCDREANHYWEQAGGHSGAEEVSPQPCAVSRLLELSPHSTSGYSHPWVHVIGSDSILLLILTCAHCPAAQTLSQPSAPSCPMEGTAPSLRLMLTPLSPLSLSVVQVMSYVGPLQVSGGDGATSG